MANFNVNIISGSVEIREGELTLSNSESTINVRTELNKKEVTTNKTLALTSESDHQQYPTAKAVYDYVSSSIAEIPKVEEIWVRGEGSGSAVLDVDANNSATGMYATAEGTGSIASGLYSHAEGQVNTAIGQTSHAEGNRSIASGGASHAEGQRGLAIGQASHAEGYNTTASARYSHVEGNRTTGLGEYSHAEGTEVITFGTGSHAEGRYTTASGDGSHAEGYSTKAIGSHSHTEGHSTLIVSGAIAAHAEGYVTTASGQYSHAEGRETEANSHGSHAEGFHTVTSNFYEHASGYYNATASNQRFSVGAGDSVDRRKNAISVIAGTTPSASIYIYGIDSYVGTNPVPGTNDLASVIAKISASAVPTDISGLFASASYDSNAKKIYFYDNQSTASGEIDATAFIKDGMVDTVTINTGSNQMIITFNTDAGKEDIELNLNDVFNPSNYYTKTDVNNFTGSWTSASNWLGTNSASINTAVGYAHTHSNKAFLDSLTEAQTASWTNASSWVGSNSSSVLTSEADPIYVADSASLKASASLASSSNYKIDHAAALVINKGAVTTTATQRYGPTGSVVTIQIPTTASHLGAANATHSHAIADVTGLNAIVSASQIVLAKTASWDASASVAKTASSSAAAISAKTGSWDALVGLPTVTAADNGKILRVVSGSWALVDPVTVYSGQGAPDSALGQDGDIYLQS